MNISPQQRKSSTLQARPIKALQKNYRRILFQVLISILAIFSIYYGWKILLPDAISAHYGFPIKWAVHELVSISGPVDIWRVKVSRLVVDLVFWTITSIIFPYIHERVNMSIKMGLKEFF